MVKKARKKDKRKGKTSFIIIDAQSVKNTDTAKHKGYDAGNKVSGIKRHIAVDSQGLPHAICITTANITDREGAKTLLRQHAKRLSRVKNVMVDGGYRGEAFANSVKGVVCGRGRNPTLRLWPTIFSGKIDVFPGDRRSRLISSMTSVAPA